MSATAARTSRSSGRDAIVRAVYDTVVEHGFGEVKARQLAEVAGVSPGLIHHHWPNLDALVVEAFELFANEVVALTTAAVDPRSNPRQQLDCLLDALLPDPDAPEVALWMEAACQARRQPALAEAVRHTNQSLTDLVTAILAQGNALGTWSCDDTTLTAGGLVAIIDGIAFHALVLETMPGKTARATARRLVDATITA